MPDRCLSCQLDIHAPADAAQALHDGSGAPCPHCPCILVVPQLGVDAVIDIRAPIHDLTRTSSVHLAAHLTATGRCVDGRWHYGYAADGSPITGSDTELTFTPRDHDEQLPGAWLHWMAFDYTQTIHVLAVPQAPPVRRAFGLLAELLAPPEADGEA